ncbi:Extracellular ligand-binding receptor [Methylobacterium sp. 4-46]|uniref:ABC transporter substrate-binding protein n=1 Tax=unclassified Methylobacterium TaxID=2615210 RepID=UPI000152E8AA|nr:MULTISPECIES: ABC transporter substrate-binding protein [Methylobacterium]ACA17903.1 Extracellular ligand-binding receptor [Methylobacterium sp. 4-46]WFT77204.1 ABC transporter substrate-binding protein [Methylobacterium nodulans]
MRSRFIGYALGLSLAAFAAAGGRAAEAVSDGVVKVGILTDMSGIYADFTGRGSAVAAQIAIDEVGGKVLGAPVELVAADHQNKPDIAANLAREWFDQGKVDMIADFPTSSTALAVMEIARQKNRVTMLSAGVAMAAITDKCSPLSAQWMVNTAALAAGTAKALLRAGRTSWYFVTADYTFGHSLERDAAAVVEAGGGKVLGTSRHPFPGGDFSSYMLKAQATGAQVIALANAGADTINAIKQAAEYGIGRGDKQVIAPLLTYITDVRSLGLAKAEGMYLTEAFYWDFDARSRAFAETYFARTKRMPSASQAAVYSAVLSYLRAIEAAGTDEAGAVMAKLRTMTIDDAVIRNGRLRADGALVHDLLLLQVKKPSESKRDWDFYTVKAVLKGEDVYPKPSDACPLNARG